MNNINKVLTALLLILIIAGFSSEYWIPKFRPFGTSTTFTDSTNYVTLNKGFSVLDSVRIAKDLYVGTSGGVLYLDTGRKGQINTLGTILEVHNKNFNGVMDFIVGGGGPSIAYRWRSVGGSFLEMDSSTGLKLYYGDIQTNGGTQQIKLPSDTVSDFDGNNAVTVNRQSGFITTKSLTTAGGTAYDITLTNSLITTSSKVHAMVIYGGGTCTNLASIIHVGVAGSGSCVISVFNPVAATSLNGTVKFQFWVWN